MAAPSLPAETARAVPPAPGSLGAALAHPIATIRWLWLAYMTPGRPGRPTFTDKSEGAGSAPFHSREDSP